MMSNNCPPGSSLTEQWNIVLLIDSALFYFFRGHEGLDHPRMGKSALVLSARSNLCFICNLNLQWLVLNLLIHIYITFTISFKAHFLKRPNLGGMGFRWRDRNLSVFIRNIFICVSKLSDSQRWLPVFNLKQYGNV